MIGLDTNVVVRYIVQDDAVQSKKATTLLESLTDDNQGFIPLVSIVELVWVLQSCYAADRKEISNVLDLLLQMKSIVIEQFEIVTKALRLFSGNNADFADCLVERSAFSAGCEYTATFDKKASKTTGMKLLA
jgi:predicted nucleic-acid-binding protein